MNILAVVVVILVVGAVAGTGVGIVTQVTDSPVADENSAPLPTQMQSSSGAQSVSPSAAVKATTAPTQMTTVSPLQQEGAALLAGNWYGDKSMPFGIVSGIFYATGNADGTAVFSGAIKAPTFGFENAEFNTPATWEYLGNNQFTAVISDTTTYFTCDGKTLTITLNAYKFGFVDTSVANVDIPVDLKRV